MTTRPGGGSRRGRGAEDRGERQRGPVEHQRTGLEIDGEECAVGHRGREALLQPGDIGTSRQSVSG